LRLSARSKVAAIGPMAEPQQRRNAFFDLVPKLDAENALIGDSLAVLGHIRDIAGALAIAPFVTLSFKNPTAKLSYPSAFPSPTWEQGRQRQEDIPPLLRGKA
jgi:hypothetical protein